jgi:hypothetical protein
MRCVRRFCWINFLSVDEMMNKDDIIRMAREAGIPETATEGVFIANSDDLGRLIAAEREKVARWQIGSGYTTGHGDTIEDLLVELEWQVRESEREACAKVCDSYDVADDVCSSDTAEGIAIAIRARGQA